MLSSTLMEVARVPVVGPDTTEGAEVARAVVELLRERWSGAESWGTSCAAFESIALQVGERYNFGCAKGASPVVTEQMAFLRTLHVEDLLLARACAAGHAPAWDAFMGRYRETLYRAAYGIAGSDATGRELADSVYADLYGMTEKDGERRSPLASYHGRGSLAGWLRSVLAQRYVDLYRKVRREESLDTEAEIAAPPAAEPASTEAVLAMLQGVVRKELKRLPPDKRFLLASYYLDGKGLKQIAAVLGVHESTISRWLSGLVRSLRKQIAAGLRKTGLSARAVEEIMEVDIRDLNIQVKAILQGTANRPFQSEAVAAMEGGEADG
jgi:RNA polymerase sigma-70 factor (ECF subfamily)